MSEEEKLNATLESLKGRKSKAEDRLKAAEESGADTVDALRSGLEKIDDKITATETQLSELINTTSKE